MDAGSARRGRGGWSRSHRRARARARGIRAARDVGPDRSEAWSTTCCRVQCIDRLGCSPRRRRAPGHAGNGPVDGSATRVAGTFRTADSCQRACRLDRCPGPRRRRTAAARDRVLEHRPRSRRRVTIDRSEAARSRRHRGCDRRGPAVHRPRVLGRSTDGGQPQPRAQLPTDRSGAFSGFVSCLVPDAQRRSSAARRGRAGVARRRRPACRRGAVGLAVPGTVAVRLSG